jgi:hypothetical protein
LSFSLSNCQVEEIDNSTNSAIQTIKPNEAILFLQNNIVLNSNKKGKTITFSPDLNNITLEKLTNSDQLLTVIPLDQNLKDTSSRILLLKINSEIKSVIFTMFATSSPNSKHFSGKIIITDLNGVFINGFSVKDGVISAKLKKKAPTNTTSRTIIIDGVEFEELDEVIIINNYQQGPGKFTLLTLFNPTLQGGGGPYDGINWEYENNGGGGGGAEPIVEEEDFEDKIDDSKLDPCPQGIMEKLKNNTTCDIANVLQKMGAKKGIAVNMTSGTPKDSAIANTNYTTLGTKYDYTITLSRDYSDANQLFIASVLLHELTHAFFLSLVDDYQSSNNQNVFIEFPILFQKFVDTKYPGSKIDAHHETMANQYINAIGAALQEFQTGVPPAYGLKPDQIYTDMAWGGLVKTPIYDKMIPIGSAERRRIENRYQAESTNRPVGQGTPSVQNPIGKPCI